ncbi:hypothetical protein Xmau_00485 [Xenorhabdus mauleonii]|uniref:Uncharacterized protein n=1 Tax=Xenorhabdus mauleonii TaxID=351675 RepID=A0A1I3J4C7_9GAMM|nr:hypothetical protein [Xenorhabdus mauleonii]PHM46089.1 hypothetical protein Xmau_00485 [Xenorhabdus mauleonii]SFI55039.1 hypothetical protein SAMN05421680_10280 [Xenorhabdus mauleonii]
MVGKKNNMEISIMTHADLVIGQYVSFVVTLNSDEPIEPCKSIIIKNNSNNIQFDKMIIPISNDTCNLLSGGTATLGFTVLQKVGGQTVKDGSPITFDVTTDALAGGNGFETVKFTGKANELDINSLHLFIEHPYLQVPSGSSKLPSTAIHTTLKNKNTNKELIGTPIFITSFELHEMKEFVFKDAKNNKEIPVEKVGPNDGITIFSDSQGVVKFYLSPKLPLSNILGLKTVILNTRYESYSKVIHVVNDCDPINMELMDAPDISDYDPDGIAANAGLSYFLVSIYDYNNKLKIDDIVLFFVNGNYTGISVAIVDPKKQLNNYSMQVPYSIFTQGVSSQFSYKVIRHKDISLCSEALPVTYLGGIPYEPDPAVKRNYNPCIVHTSLGVGPDNTIPSGYGNYVNYDAIMKYPGYKYSGLFVEILCSDTHDPNATVNSVPLNINDITLNMYINSDNKNFKKSYNQQITLNEIGSDGNANSIFFHIPYGDIVDVRGTGNISFDYQFYLPEQLGYGVSWDANIGTIPDPGHTDNN